jgi:hypothetical protein
MGGGGSANAGGEIRNCRLVVSPSAHRCGYFSAFFTAPNVEFNFVPNPCVTVMIATEMPAAISPYSIAVAPDSSAQKRLTKAVIFVAPFAALQAANA